MKKTIIAIATLAAGMATAATTPAIISSQVRANDPTVLDVVYRVTSDKPTVNVRALAFEDGERSFWKVVRPETFIDGTAANIGDNIAANANHTLSWKVSSDWATDLAKVKFEVLTSEQGQLPLDWVKIPGVNGVPDIEVSYNSQTDSNVINALYWYYASSVNDLTIDDGYLKNTNDVTLVSRTSVSDKFAANSNDRKVVMFDIPQDSQSRYSFLSLFSGAGGLDIGFERAGFAHTESSDILPYAVNTMRRNRPDWKVLNCDVREYSPRLRGEVDVLLAGFPCQGFSLGGNRVEDDKRNTLYKEVVRIADAVQPRVVVMENVLNLRTMRHPITRKPFAEQIASEMAAIGYTTRYEFFRVSRFGAPQTRLQTFPDSWVFYGDNKRELQLQVGNAVPVAFAKKNAVQVRAALEVADGLRKYEWQEGEQMELF